MDVYNLHDSQDITRLHEQLFNDEPEDDSFGDESDTDCEDNIQEREEDSETEQSCDDLEDENSHEATHYTANRMKNKKVIDSYQWNKYPYTNRRKFGKQNLLVRLPGVIGDAKNATTILDTWLCLVDESTLNSIVLWTNKYIDLVRSAFSRPRDARSTDLVEMKAIIGLLYLAGVYRGSRLNLEDLWDPSGDGVETFRLTMSLKRFRFLMRCIRFDNKDTRKERKKIDRLAPIRDVFEAFVSNCQRNYSLGENVTLDEKLEAFRGRCCFRQYIPSKPAKYGLKIFALVDSKMYYTSNMELYAGKQPDGPYAVSNHSTDVVRRLVHPIKNTGRNLTCDNWFNDVSLLTELAVDKISCVATLKKNKWQIPAELKCVSNRNERSSIFGFRKEGTIVSYVPRKNKNVILISSLHFDDTIDEDTGPLKKPEIITFYNKTKGGVDTVDKLCATYNVARNNRRWPMVIFFSMLNVAGINAQVIYFGNGHTSTRRTFLRQLAKSLVIENMVRRSNEKTTLSTGLKYRLAEVTKQPLKRLSATTSQEDSNQTNKRKLCQPCHEDKQRKNTKILLRYLRKIPLFESC